MEEELIRLEKELDDLYENAEGDVWRQLNKWEKRFWRFVDLSKSKYDWREDEFEKIKGKEILKDSFRERMNSYKKLFEKIKDKE